MSRGTCRVGQRLPAESASIRSPVTMPPVRSPLENAARIASEAMRNAFAPLEVPLLVGVEAGPNWADLEPVTS